MLIFTATQGDCDTRQAKVSDVLDHTGDYTIYRTEGLAIQGPHGDCDTYRVKDPKTGPRAMILEGAICCVPSCCSVSAHSQTLRAMKAVEEQHLKSV